MSKTGFDSDLKVASMKSLTAIITPCNVMIVSNIGNNYNVLLIVL